MVKPADKVSAGFGRNPKEGVGPLRPTWGWHEFWSMTLSLPLLIFAI